MDNSDKIFDVAKRTDLKSALDSENIALSSYFSPTRKAALLVLVEGEDDIPFWTELFQCVKDKYSEINVTTLKQRTETGTMSLEVNEAGDELSALGKESLMSIEGLGSNKVVAIDRDYDGLIANYHHYSGRLQNDPYVISTTYYSIENHLVWSGAVNKCLQTILGSTTDYRNEYNNVIKQYNDTIRPLVVLLLACVLSRITTKQKQEYHISDLTSDVAALNQDSKSTSMRNCQIEAINKNSKLLKKYKKRMTSIEALLTAHAKYPDSLWKVIQGHTLYSFVSGYMERIVAMELKSKIHCIYLQYQSDISKAKKEETKFKKNIIATYDSIGERVFEFLYKNPIIDYSDIGIKKIIDKIQKL